jgi:hypothetical protein
MAVITSTDAKVLEWMNSSALQHLPENKRPIAQEALTKLQSAVNAALEMDLGEIDTDLVNSTLENLERVTKNYHESLTITDVMVFENLKKELIGHLGVLVTLKADIMNRAKLFEEYAKKEYRVTVIKELMVEENYSMSKADKLVEDDSRYLLVKNQAYKFTEYANLLKDKYAYYYVVWQSIFQTVSYLGKEKFSTITER